MKTNLTRILCLVLVLMMSVTLFVACKPDDTVTKTDVTKTDVTSVPENVIVEVTEDDPYTIAKDVNGKDIVILTPNDDGSVTMTVAEKTTLEAFLAVVTAKEGFTIKVSDAEGNEVTDNAMIIAKGMKFEVFADGETTAKVSMVIDVVTAAVIESTVQVQSQINSIIAQQPKPDNSNSGESTDESDPSGPIVDSSTTSTERGEIEITLASIWASHYTASDAGGKAYQTTLNSMSKHEKINTTIIPLSDASATDLIVKEVMAGKSSADVFDISQVMCRNVAKKKAAVNIFASKTLNKSLYQTGATESATFNGKAYGVAFASKSVNPMGVVYNKSLIKKYAPDYDIVALFNQKKWDFNTFREIAKLCTQDTNGDSKSDIFGFTSNTNIIGMALTSNAGGTALKINEKVEATMCNAAGVEALVWCKEMFRVDRSWKYMASINDCVTVFAAGQAAMFVSYMQFYPQIAAQANFDMGFVLMPMGPAQKDYKNGVYDCSLFVVPKTKEGRLDDIGLWLNGIAGASTKLLNVKITDMARNGMDSTSQQIYKWLVNNMTPEYSSGIFSGDISSEVDSSVTNAAKDPSKVMAAIRTKAQKECDDYYADLY